MSDKILDYIQQQCDNSLTLDDSQFTFSRISYLENNQSNGNELYSLWKTLTSWLLDSCANCIGQAKQEVNEW